MRILSGLLIFALLSGCAGYRPTVDMQGVNQDQYEQDLVQCQEYATQVSPASSAAIGAVAGAAGAAILGLVAAAVFDLDIGEVVGGAAALGGTMSAMEGGVAGAKSQMEIITTCMSGRGYKVLK